MNDTASLASDVKSTDDVSDKQTKAVASEVGSGDMAGSAVT